MYIYIYIYKCMDAVIFKSNIYERKAVTLPFLYTYKGEIDKQECGL